MPDRLTTCTGARASQARVRKRCPLWALTTGAPTSRGRSPSFSFLLARQRQERQGQGALLAGIAM